MQRMIQANVQTEITRHYYAKKTETVKTAAGLI